MEFVPAAMEDFEEGFRFIQDLWDYNTYDEESVRKVWREVLEDPDTFAFFVRENGQYVGFCQGDFFNTFWMSGLTCYVSGIITAESCRERGIGRAMMDHTKELAKARGCKAIILDSGLPRKTAHRFYEGYGFERSCYGFELKL